MVGDELEEQNLFMFIDWNMIIDFHFIVIVIAIDIAVDIE
jgi:hypothetical protein